MRSWVLTGALALVLAGGTIRASGLPTLLTLLQAGFDPREPGLAVLVQGELALERFCVCFSVDPRGPAAPPLVEAVAGGGAALMAVYWITHRREEVALAAARAALPPGAPPRTEKGDSDEAR